MKIFEQNLRLLRIVPTRGNKHRITFDDGRGAGKGISVAFVENIFIELLDILLLFHGCVE